MCERILEYQKEMHIKVFKVTKWAFDFTSRITARRYLLTSNKAFRNLENATSVSRLLQCDPVSIVICMNCIIVMVIVTVIVAEKNWLVTTFMLWKYGFLVVPLLTAHDMKHNFIGSTRSLPRSQALKLGAGIARENSQLHNAKCTTPYLRVAPGYDALLCVANSAHTPPYRKL